MKIKQYPIVDLSEIREMENAKNFEHASEVLEGKKEVTAITLDISAIKQEAFISGKSEAERSIESQKMIYTQNLLSIVQELQEKFTKISMLLEEDKATLIDDSIELCLTIARKIAEKSVEGSGFNLIKNFLSEQLPTLYSGELITVKVAPEYVEDIRKYIDSLTRTKNYHIDMDIIFDDDMKPGDCSIEFSGGKIVKDKSKLLFQLEHLLNNYYEKKLESVDYVAHIGSDVKN